VRSFALTMRLAPDSGGPLPWVLSISHRCSCIIPVGPRCIDQREGIGRALGHLGSGGKPENASYSAAQFTAARHLCRRADNELLCRRPPVVHRHVNVAKISALGASRLIPRIAGQTIDRAGLGYSRHIIGLAFAFWRLG